MGSLLSTGRMSHSVRRFILGTINTRLLGVFQSVFGDDIEALDDRDSIDGLPGWDSAGHLNLIMAVEAEFGVQFEIDEMESLTSVSALRARLDGT